MCVSNLIINNHRTSRLNTFWAMPISSVAAPPDWRMVAIFSSLACIIKVNYSKAFHFELKFWYLLFGFSDCHQILNSLSIHRDVRKMKSLELFEHFFFLMVWNLAGLSSDFVMAFLTVKSFKHCEMIVFTELCHPSLVTVFFHDDNALMVMIIFLL